MRSISAWPVPRGESWWRWTPTPSSIPTRFRGWCAGSPIPQVGAVAGNAKVGNRINMITRWQALEYIVAQNLERRALVGAGHADRGAGRGGRLAARGAAASWAAFPPTRWRKTRISPSPSRPRAIACCSTPAPSPGRKRPPRSAALAKQRFRWAYGTLQCLWKYRRITFNPRYRRAGHGGAAAGLAVPDPSHHAGAAGRSAAGLAAGGAMDRLYAARRGIHRATISHRRHLLLRLHRGGSAGRR